MSKTITLHIAQPNEPRLDTDELSDADLEQVVGGLSRVWTLGPTEFFQPVAAPLSVTLISSIGRAQRIPA